MPRKSKKRVLEVGEMFGFWKVIEDGDKTSVRCACTGCDQTLRTIAKSELLASKTQSCGCMRKANKVAKKESGNTNYKSSAKHFNSQGFQYSEYICGYEVLFTKEPTFRSLGLFETSLKKIDMRPGDTFGSWRIDNFVDGVSYVLCTCLGCENKTQRVMRRGVLTTGQTNSCGCQVSQKSKASWDRLKKAGRVEEIVNKRKETCLEKYGETSYTKTEEYLEKAIETNIKKYGYSFHSQRPEFKEIVQNANLKKFGVHFPSQLEEQRAKIMATNLERYGVAYPFQMDHAVKKIDQIRQERAEKAQERNAIREVLRAADNKWREENKDLINQIKFKKRTQTNLERFGSPVPPVKPETIEKIKQTNLERYGATTILATPELREKTKKSHLEKYGVENCFQSEKFQKEIKPQINLEKYGTENPGTLPSSIEKGKQTSLKKYGVDSFSKLPEERQKRREKNMEMETSFSSKGELAILEHVKQRFPDVRKLKIKHHELDIFIPELNFGIEFNGLCYHHVKAKHPYYHLAKSDFFKRHQIDIVHIWDYEFNKFKDQVLNFIDLRIDFQMKKLINHQFSFSYSKNPEKIKKVTSLQKDFYRFDRKDILAIVEVFDSKGSLVGSVSLQNYQGKPIIRNYFSYSSKILNLQIGLAAKKFLEDLFKQKYPILIDRRFYFDFSDLNLVEYFEPLKFWQIRGRFLKDGDFNLAPLQTIDLEKESDILISRNENLYELESEVWDCGAAIYL